ncbi:OST-HTH/LOTUS domain-containing protein [Myroides ceti]|uniref:OST-HTH/LOTUS domain-containing protein n=1 Tax=Paenimyroides ceti TaxID=395087 RepID=A0ABT8CXX0_9FLAO|nr:OST-HTH/LOTUS domain-containing protein [Paenimyroides ceti]MDN3708986.1 OST-HTH/LOTUS domain-containing protein [Paenimyroides ceti]
MKHLHCQSGIIAAEMDPSFDARTYGFKNLTQLFESLKKYEVIKNEVNGLKPSYGKIKIRVSIQNDFLSLK